MTEVKADSPVVPPKSKSRRAWLGPLIVAAVILAALFFFVHSPMDIPFLYRWQ